MKAREVRRAFVDFFVERGHSHQPSASLIPHDPTVLFTVAGMVPFKPYFVGEEVPPFKRAVTVQKCVRAGGKHNDLDEIGRTSRHLTFFEMLGNFSFGDYFKSEAIAWSWEFVTEVLGLDPDRLWVTVHVSDDEAAAIWRDEVGVPPERIQHLDEDNFWRMADTGPCGPSSEIFWDNGPEHGEGGGPEHGDEDRFVEIWNLVFMQFEQLDDGSQIPLPKPSIDTGMGLERTTAVLQGVDSVWETDEFRALMAIASDLTGVDVTDSDEEMLVSLRILADHARSTSMLVSDGVLPSNEARGYVLRRIIRRAVRHAYLLGVEEPVMGGMVDAVVDVMGEDYPDLVAHHQLVRDVIEREELKFRETLRTGQAILDTELERLVDGEPLPGDVAFLLHDTYGFPLEVTQEITGERGVTVDVDGFEVAMAEQRRRAKDARKTVAGGDTARFVAILEDSGETEFTGRDEDTSTATVLLVDDDIIVLDRTPFYAESGGQIGDSGTITTDTGRARVTDTQYGVPGIHLHSIEPVEGVIEVGQTATASIDSERRAAIRRNHTGTHIVHWALREVLGDHVKQQGSWVGPDRLRFDFSHHEAMTDDQIAAVEDLANAEILDNASCHHFETTMEDAEDRGAIAFFGEKYGDRVRVLEAGRHSVELCGGTHVNALGDIGTMRIVSEGSIGSNIRRIEAVTGTGTVELLRERDHTLSAAAEALGVPVEEIIEGIEKRQADTKELRAEVAGLRRQLAVSRAPELADSAVDGVVVARIDDIDRDGLRDLAVTIRDLPGVEAVVLGAVLDNGGVALASAATVDGGFDAGALIEEAKATIGGGGRAAPDLSVAGGKDASRLDEALDQARAAAAGTA
jgi:alanyl-tRNA synthetase